MKNVKSSNIKSIGFVNKTKTLLIEFLNKRTYKYLNVPKEIYNEFLSSESKGKFFNSKIKNVFSFEEANAENIKNKIN